MKASANTAKRLTKKMIAILFLALCLCVTTFALVNSTVTVKDNQFQTGTIKVNLNDGKPIITEKEFLFEPGMTVEKNFFIENEGTWDVYYKLYLNDMAGGLADVLDVSIRNGETVLFSGKAADLTRENVGAADDILRLGERRELTISFCYPKNAGNSTQNQYLSFALSADAVQTKNNPHKLFD